MSYLLEPVSKFFRVCFAVNARGHNGKEIEQGSCALIDRNAVDSNVDRIS